MNFSINDYVQVPSELNRVKHIHSTFDLDEVCLYRPIPITDKFLQSFMEFDSLLQSFKFKIGEEQTLLITKNTDGSWYVVCGHNLCMVIKKISYIHELQHILRIADIEEVVSNLFNFDMYD